MTEERIIEQINDCTKKLHDSVVEERPYTWCECEARINLQEKRLRLIRELEFMGIKFNFNSL